MTGSRRHDGRCGRRLTFEALERRDLLSVAPAEPLPTNSTAARPDDHVTSGALCPSGAAGAGDVTALALADGAVRSAASPQSQNLVASGQLADTPPLTGIGDDVAPWNVLPTAPAGFPQGLAWMIAVQDTRRQDTATVEVAWMRLHATVNGQDSIIALDDYGTGAGQQPFVTGDLGSRSNWFAEQNGNVAKSFTATSMIVQPSDQPDMGYHWWSNIRGTIPAGATNVWAEAMVKVSGSGVVEIGVDYQGPSGIRNGSGSGFTTFASPDWKIITAGKLDSAPPPSQHPWQNALNPLDVNADGVLTGLDALLVINELKGSAGGPIPAAPAASPPFLDVSGDNFVTSLDALIVIHALNEAAAQSSQAGSGAQALPVAQQEVVQDEASRVERPRAESQVVQVSPDQPSSTILALYAVPRRNASAR